MTKYILASGSPRRIELIKKLGIGEEDITVMPSNIEEILPEGLSPGDTVCSLALQKAQSVAAALAASSDDGKADDDGSDGSNNSSGGMPLIIAADTMVYVDGCPLGKPADKADAADMLKALSGRRHSVYTGIALLRGSSYITGVEKTDVFFRDLSDAEIDAYVATGEPMDKAGAYAAQEGAAVFVERIEGDFWNIVGLPLCRLSMMLRERNIQS